MGGLYAGGCSASKKLGFIVNGFNALLTSDVPVGGGMSSSAAIQCTMFFDLNEKFNIKVESLRDVNFSMLEMNLKNTATTFVYNRCRFIVKENLWVQIASQLLKRNDGKNLAEKYIHLKCD